MISSSAWSSDLFGRLSSLGFNGTELDTFASAVGIGSAESVIGKSFVTVDVGTISGSGTGLGTGITGLSPGMIASNIFGLASSQFGQAGIHLMDFCTAIAESCVAQLALATLMSVDAPVFTGVGTITPGSITVVPMAWGSLVQSSAPTFVGTEWPAFANAIGQGQALEVIAAGTGTLVITPVPIPAPTGPGTGAGAGTIS